MFNRNTLFVIGAGASVDFGFPVGSELKNNIAQLVKFNPHDRNRASFADENLRRAIYQYAKQNHEGDVNPLSEACEKIMQGMPLINSIDDFIDLHKEDKAIEFCGKLAIVKEIADAESKCILRTDSFKNKTIDFSKTSDTWLNMFMLLLMPGITKSNIDNAFKNISFIIFNYDRCIEQYLVKALVAVADISERDSRDIVNEINIIHPYGKIGRLPWQSEESNVFDFGDEVTNIFNLTTEIKTYTEQIEEKTVLDKIHDLVIKAETLVFLGFGYHEQNMELLKPDEKNKVKTVYSSTYETSESDIEVIKSDINRLLFFKNKPKPDIRLKDGTCPELFAEYNKSITQ